MRTFTLTLSDTQLEILVTALVNKLGRMNEELYRQKDLRFRAYQKQRIDASREILSKLLQTV